MQAADLDGDGHLDVLTALYEDDSVVWEQNLDGQGDFSADSRIIAQSIRAYSVAVADLDGDDFADVVAVSRVERDVAWYANVAAGTGFVARTIGPTASLPYAVFAADLDGDDHLDVLTTASSDNSVSWYKNTDGNGAFGSRQFITEEAMSARAIYAADLDGDGDQDVLSASFADDKIAWYQNTDGLGNFGPQQVISIEAKGAQSVTAIDLDGDGDMDVLSASLNDNKIAWYRNVDGLGTFGPQEVITTDAIGARFVDVADLDGDGDMDVLSASSADDKIAWYENRDGRGDFGPQQVITTAANSAQIVRAFDLDGDGDRDVLSASSIDDKIAWYENTDARGTFGPQQVITTSADRARSVDAADFDGDGDLDVVSASFGNGAIVWYENRTVGDANGDGNFDSSDLVLVSQAGKYEDTVPNNASFDEGDWNGDGDFDSADLILALSVGHYQPDAASVPADIAAAVDRVFADHTHRIR